MEIEELLTCMQNPWNYTIHIPCLVPGGVKHKPDSARLEGGTEGPIGIEWAQEAKYRLSRKTWEHFRAHGAWCLSGSPAQQLLDQFGKVPQSHQPSGVLGSSGCWRGMGMRVGGEPAPGMWEGQTMYQLRLQVSNTCFTVPLDFTHKTWIKGKMIIKTGVLN